MRCPLRYSLREDSGERTTSKFSLVKKVNQKGRFSYMFSPKGMPMRPREPSPPPCRGEHGASDTCTASGRAGGGLLPRGREQRLPEIKRRPPSKVLTVREQWLVHRPQVAGLAVWVNFSRSWEESRALRSRCRSRAARAARRPP